MRRAIVMSDINEALQRNRSVQSIKAVPRVSIQSDILVILNSFAKLARQGAIFYVLSFFLQFSSLFLKLLFPFFSACCLSLSSFSRITGHAIEPRPSPHETSKPQRR